MWQYVAAPVSPRKTKKVTFLFFFSFGGDVWQYVAVPASPRKTKKVTFLKRFFLGWRCVAICGGTGIATENKKSDFF